MIENINFLIKNLIKDTKKIKYKKITSTQKNKLYKTLAINFKKKIKPKLSYNSYSTYLSRARRQFANIKHHNLEKKILIIKKKFIFFKKEIKKIFKKKIIETKLNIQKLKNKLNKINYLKKETNNIKILSLNNKNINILKKIIIKIPEWKKELKTFFLNKWFNISKNLILKINEGEKLINIIKKLKIKHEILFHLRTEKKIYNIIKKKSLKKLKEKKTLTINYKLYLQEIYNILYSPINTQLNKIKQISLLLFALSAVSGRKMIEIIKLGKFKKINKNLIKFKKQEKISSKTYNIYILCNTSLFINKIKNLRKSKIIKKIIKETKNKKKYISVNTQISTKISSYLNKWVKYFFKNNSRSYKDSINIYTKIVYEKWFKKNPKWININKNIIFSKIIGYKNKNTYLYQKKFKLYKFIINWKPVINTNILCNLQLQKLKSIDNKINKIIKRKKSYKIHETTKNIIEKEPTTIISSYKLRKFGFNPKLIQKYLNFISKYIKQTKINNKYTNINKNNKIIIND